MTKICLGVPGVARGLMVLAGLAALPSVALAGPDWVEHGDAGSNFSTAQPAFGGVGGQLRSISGSLSSGFDGPDYEDCYLIKIVDPTTFRFEITNAGFDIQIWLFNVTLAGSAYGLLANQTSPSNEFGAIITNQSTDGTNVLIDAPGDYMIAITGAGNVPLSRTGEIFHFSEAFEISGADGPGGLNPLTGWSGPGASGGYNIELEGSAGPTVPTPGTAAMLLASAGVMFGRRRR